MAAVAAEIRGWEYKDKKVKFTLEQATKAQRGSRYITLLFLQPRRYMGVGGQRQRPRRFIPGKDPVPIV